MELPSIGIATKQDRPGHRALGVGVALLLAVVIAALGTGALAPDRALAHAGEVHTEEPQTSASDSGQGSGMQSGSGKSADTVPDESAKAEARAPASSSPPVPEEPESDPLLHFAALGVAALAGLGLLLVRRRRLTG